MPIILVQQDFYNANPSADNISRVQAQIDTVKDVMIENIDRVLERGEKIELLVDKTDRLNQQAYKFEKQVSVPLPSFISLFISKFETVSVAKKHDVLSQDPELLHSVRHHCCECCCVLFGTVHVFISLFISAGDFLHCGDGLWNHFQEMLRGTNVMC